MECRVVNHFEEGGFDTIEWLEINVDNEIMKQDVITLLKGIHVPGEIFENMIKVYGYKKDGLIEYL